MTICWYDVQLKLVLGLIMFDVGSSICGQSNKWHSVANMYWYS